ncbi:tryptophan 2,3-dioxygenase family protein [Saccharomonospora piscinae]|uniref:Tryptophan 2,3-dioxygenase n=1 Tax=Saccharomonospora piscinae TaxID=687388 RepID=W5VMS0_SACPI|nr:tryptophan 2,3-dioxygenase family protein [Saccharomonospora piscinae]AHH53511.1 tryptophan 2,3-dioxygenase [Saccharomonospora piscinae]
MTERTATRTEPAYGEILRLDELLELACVNDEADRALFLSAHQACEIWFAVVLRHLEDVTDALSLDDGATAAELLERLPRIITVIIEHFEVLGTLKPEAFDRIRADLGSSSGFQSVQYREIEYLCGARDTRFLNTAGFRDRDRRRLRERLAKRSLSNVFLEYRGRAGDRDACRISDALHEFDDSVRALRLRHAGIAELFLGSIPGTAGTAGAAYLRRSASRTLFPELFDRRASGTGG